VAAGLSIRPGRTVLLVVIVGIALSPIVGVLVERQSADRASREVSRALAGPTPLRLVGSTIKAGLVPEVVDQVGAVPGVRGTVPVVQAITYVDGIDDPILVLGVDCSIRTLLADLACDRAALASPTAPVFVSTVLRERLGQSGSLRGTEGSVDVAHLTPLPALDEVNQGRVAVTGLRRAQAMFVRGDRLDVVYLDLAPDADVDVVRDSVQRAVGVTARVLAPDDPAPGPDVAARLSDVLAVIALFAIVLGWLLVRGICRLSLLERRREIAIEMAVGRSRAGVMRRILVEAACAGVAGGLLATVGGVVVGSLLVEALGDLVTSFSGVVVTTSVTWQAGAAAVVVALLVVTSAFAVPAWSVAQVDIPDVATAQHAQAEPDRSPRWPLVVGLGATVIGLALSQVATGERSLRSGMQIASMLGLALTVVGVFTVAGALLPSVLGAASRLSSRAPRLRLVLGNLQGHGRRVGAVALSVVFAVALAVVIGGFGPAITRATRDHAERHVRNRLAANTVAFNDSLLLDAKIGRPLLQQISDLAGGRVSRDVSLLTRAGSPRTEIAVTAYEDPQLDLRRLVGAEPEDALTAGKAVVGAPLARSLDLELGEAFEIDAAGTAFEIEVGSVTESLTNAGMVVVVPIGVVDRYWGWLPPHPLMVGPLDPPGPGGGVGASDLARLDPHLQVVDAEQLAEDDADSVDTYLAPFEILQDALFVVVGVTTFTTIMLVSLQRRRELALLAAVGLSAVGLRALALVEAGIISIVGGATGAGAGLVISLPLRNAAAFSLGVRLPLYLSFGSVALAFLAGASAVLLGGLLPADRLRKLDIQTALQAE
jgi:putative ABC transport system permease protein